MANNRKYKTDPELLLAQGKAIVAAGEEARYQHKVGDGQPRARRPAPEFPRRVLQRQQERQRQ